MTFDANAIVIDAFAQRLVDGFRETYGSRMAEYGSVIAWGARIAADIHTNLGDAPYHDFTHVVEVTLCGQEILKGRHMVDPLRPTDWLHVLLACAFHDIGYVRFLLPSDKDRVYPPGATGAILEKSHVERSQEYVQRRFHGHEFIDASRLAEYIGFTRFPVLVPDEESEESRDKGSDTSSLGGLVRAADFIGQLATLNLRKRQWALYQESLENGVARRLGYNNVDDMYVGFPSFFFDHVRQFIRDGIAHLERTPEGNQIVNNLFANVFRAQHRDVWCD